MDRGLVTVSPGTTAHLVELDAAERQAKERDVTDAGKVHPLAKGARGDDAGEVAATEGPLDAGARRAREPGMIERRARGELGDSVAQRAREGDGLVARRHVHHALLAPRNDAHEGGLAVAQLAAVVDQEVLATRQVQHHVLARNARQRADARRHVGRGGRRRPQVR